MGQKRNSQSWFDYRSLDPVAQARSFSFLVFNHFTNIFPETETRDLLELACPDASSSTRWPDARKLDSLWARLAYHRFKRLSLLVPKDYSLAPSAVEMAAVLSHMQHHRWWGWFFRIGLDERGPIEFERFQAAVVHQALLHPGFRLALTTVLRRHLVTRFIIEPNSLPLVRFADETLLLITVGNPASPSSTRSDAGSISKLKKVAQAVFEEEGRDSAWAGFWDQYILRQFSQRITRLPNPATLLPLVSQGADAMIADPNGDHVWAKPGWRDEAPPFSERLLASLP
jgi:hypothetical protein